MRPFARFLLIVVLLPLAALADIQLPRLLSDGVVLQRDTTTSLWGWADERERVEVFVDGVLAGSVVAEDGQWRVGIGSYPAGGPHRIEVVGRNRTVIDDVLFGDVWIASGQSNMVLPMARVRETFPDDIATADFPRIRHFTVPREQDFVAPREDVNAGEWQAITPASIMDFSATGFFFARALYKQYGVPIGIVSTNYGGSGAESWMSEEALEAYPHYLEIAKRFRAPGYLQSLIDEDNRVADEWYGRLDENDTGLTGAQSWYAPDLDDSDWLTRAVPGFWSEFEGKAGVFWLRRTIDIPEDAAGKPARLLFGRVVDADTTWVNGIEVGNVTYEWPPRHYDIEAGVLRPGRNVITLRIISRGGNAGPVPDKAWQMRIGGQTIDLAGDWRFRVGATQEPIAPLKFVRHRQPLGFYNAMLAPLLKLSIKGVIWYQGETNVGRADEYVHLFRALIRSWREDFGQGDFPFLFVQLASLLEPQDEPGESDWAELRAAQAQALSEPSTAMATALDVGEWNDVHPQDKKTVGERLALAARHVAYGEEDLVHSGPVARAAVLTSDNVVVQYDHVGGGLHINGDALRGFAVAADDGAFIRADARIYGEIVIVTSEDVHRPMRLRYAWADNPDTANLYNDAGLPALPFEIAVTDQPPSAQ